MGARTDWLIAAPSAERGMSYPTEAVSRAPGIGDEGVMYRPRAVGTLIPGAGPSPGPHEAPSSHERGESALQRAPRVCRTRARRLG